MNRGWTWDKPKPKIVELTKDEYNTILGALYYVECPGSVARELYERLKE